MQAVEMGNVFHSHKCLTISFTVCIITHAEAYYGLTLTSFVVKGFLECIWVYKTNL